MRRREFLKYCAVAGVAVPSKVWGWPAVPAILGENLSNGRTASATYISWANWNAISQDTLNVDQDGDGAADTVVCVHDASGAGDDETARGGGLTGVDLILGDSGNIAAASGSPPRRNLDGSDCLEVTNAWHNTLIKDQSACSVFFHLYNWIDQTTYDALMRWSGGAGEEILIRVESNKLRVLISNSGATCLTGTTTDTIPTNTELWIGVWFDGTYWRAGFTSGTSDTPTKWSDFAAGKRLSNGGPPPAIDWSLSGGTYLFYNDSGTTTRWVDAEISSIVMSKTCLIDNAS